MEDCLEFTGFRSDVPQLIQDLTILVHASTSGEPFGQVIIEAMAAGKPVVATTGGGVPEIVRTASPDSWFPWTTHRRWPMRLFACSPILVAAAAMGAAGHQRVQEYFTIECTVHKVESVYEDILGPRPIPHHTAGKYLSGH